MKLFALIPNFAIQSAGVHESTCQLVRVFAAYSLDAASQVLWVGMKIPEKVVTGGSPIGATCNIRE